MFKLITLIFIQLSCQTLGETLQYEVDPSGYLIFCPCMGRFGNQADHFLGSLSFAHALNRTLLLPPWVEYRKGHPKSVQVPFSRYFKVDELAKFTRVLPMEEFMEHLADRVWPAEKRVAFCYQERRALNGSSSSSCNAKEGNPFASFWDTFGIDFVGSEFFGPLNYDVKYQHMDHKWTERYGPAEWPVLAFTGAPATFPVQPDDLRLHKYLKWSDEIDKSAVNFIRESLPAGGFIGVHLRNGIDWIRACEHVKDSRSLFSSPQCLGYMNEHGNLTMDICMPTQELIVKKIKRRIKKVRDLNNGSLIKSVFVASDNNHMLEYLNNQLARMDVKAFKLPENHPHVDLAILGRSNYFIGNCVSSFSAFVKRERDARGFPSEFFGFPAEKSQEKKRRTQHDEF